MYTNEYIYLYSLFFRTKDNSFLPLAFYENQ